jgi:LysM repeat protein
VKIHIVKKGDTLVGLANKYKVELDALIALNPQISDPNQIDAGMKVKIPSHPMPVAPPESDYAHKHIVKQGDSLWKLGKAWDISLQAMIKANPQLKNPNVLMTGEIVYIPKLESNQGPAAPEQQPLTTPFQPLAMAPSMYPAIPQQEAAVSDSGTAPVQPTPLPTGDQDVSGSLNTSYSDWIQTAQSTPQVPSESAIEEAYWNVPSQAQQETLQESAFVEPPAPNLNMPYQQTQHPFAHVHIEATEVFAQPGQMEVSNEPVYMGNQPYQAYPTSSAYPIQPGYSDGGCGCGGYGGYMSASVQPWNAYPSYPPMTLPSYATQHFMGGYPGGQSAVPSYPIGGEFVSGLPFGGMAPGTGQPAYPSPYEAVGMMPGMGNPAYPGDYAPAGTIHGMGNPPYPASYEATGYPPEAHIHQWPGKEDIEPEKAREASAEKNGEKTSGKSTGSAKKKSTAGDDSLAASLKKLQIHEERAEPKPNLPWINV